MALRWVRIEAGVYESTNGGYRIEKDGPEWVGLEMVSDYWSWLTTRRTLRACKADAAQAFGQEVAYLVRLAGHGLTSKGRVGSESDAAPHRERDVQALVGTRLPQAMRLGSDTTGE